ncbi:MAG: helix-turn-helix domain-containing protein [Pirellulaceae bacterium]
MKVEFNGQELAPLIEQIVQVTIEQLNSQQCKLNGRIGFTEREAAELLGVQQHTLRDCRLRGEISAKKMGSRYVYAAETLRKYLK